MQPDLTNPQNFQFIRQDMIQQGHDPDDVDKFLTGKLAEQQTIQFAQEGLIKPGDAATSLVGVPGAVEALSEVQGEKAREDEEIAGVVRKVLSQFERVPEEHRGPVKGHFTSRFPFGEQFAESRRFEKTRSGVAGALKKVVGESGRLTDQDIARIKNLIPSVTETERDAEFAIEDLKDFLREQGIEVDQEQEQELENAKALGGTRQAVPNNVVSFDALQQAQAQGLPADEASTLAREAAQQELAATGGVAGTEEDIGDEEERRTAQELADRGFFENLTSIEGTRRFLSEAPGGAAEALKTQGGIILDLFQGDLESAIEKGEEFRTEAEQMENLRKAAQAEIGTKIEAVTAIGALKNFFSKNVLNKLKGTKPDTVKKVLNAAKTQVDEGTRIRTGAIEQAQQKGVKIDGTRLFNRIKQQADEAVSLGKSSQRKQMDDFLKSAAKSFKGKQLNPKTAKRKWDIAKKGFTTAGNAGNSTEAAWHRAVRDAVRKELDDVTGGAFERGTKMISQGLDEDKILSSVQRSLKRKEVKDFVTDEGFAGTAKDIAGGVGRGAATGLGIAAVAKALGINLTGGGAQ